MSASGYNLEAASEHTDAYKERAIQPTRVYTVTAERLHESMVRTVPLVASTTAVLFPKSQQALSAQACECMYAQVQPAGLSCCHLRLPTCRGRRKGLGVGHRDLVSTIVDSISNCQGVSLDSPVSTRHGKGFGLVEAGGTKAHEVLGSGWQQGQCSTSN